LVTNIFKGSRDGWSKEVFGQKVFCQGPTIVLLRTKKYRICGGFTSKSWAASGGYTNDNAAFVFNLAGKVHPSNCNGAISLRSDGFEFGNHILSIASGQLNAENAGNCNVGASNYYDISSDSSGNSNLT
jgi:hypothetical protein